MEKQSISQETTYEETLLGITRRLPPERVSQIIDFARFIAWQTFEGKGDGFSRQEEDEDSEPFGPGDEKWEHLLATPESERLLAEMAREAREDHRAGRTTDIAITDDGLLAPA